jgi:carboxypeptidase C (cathepsin A)
MRNRLLLGVAASILSAGTLSAQRPGGPPGGNGNAASARPTEGIEPVDKVSTTQHTTTINGKQIAYTARAGTMVLHDVAGKPRASIFYVSYTRDGMDPATRPVTFFFNGGPGSASVWLHMGIMSPKRALMGPNGSQPSPPYHLVDNQDSPLDVTDLVEIDAPMTGYSRNAVGVQPSTLTGAQNDIVAFAEFIRDYLDKYNRWGSPKYLFGESYGTFRSAGLSSYLQDSEGIELNGIMLLGTVLDMQYLTQQPSNDIGWATFLPTYTATAWYHHKLTPSLQKLPLTQVVQMARDFAFGDYLVDLAAGNTLRGAKLDAAAQKVADLTGLSKEYVLNANLRIEAGAYRTELLRAEHKTVGRYDSRMTGINGDFNATREDYDPSDVAPSGAFISMFMQYLHNDLNYSNDLQYYTGGHTGRWDYTGTASGFGGGFPDEIQSLRQAMSQNPYLKVLVGAGYYDMATPFGNAELDFTHLGYDTTYTNRVKFDYYESGHMAYLNQSSSKQLKANIANFIEATEKNQP